MPRNKWILCLSVALLVGLASAETTRADIVTFANFGSFSNFSNANNLTQENVLTPGAASGLTVAGFTNQTNTQVNVMSLTLVQLSVADANGQAIFTGLNGGNIGSGGFKISLANNLSFTSLAFNLNNVAGSTGTVIISTLEVNGDITNTEFAVANGSNFFGVAAINGQRIFSVTVGPGVQLQDVRQVRIGGTQGPGVPVPEPATMLLLGTGLIGVAARFRKRRQA